MTYYRCTSCNEWHDSSGPACPTLTISYQPSQDNSILNIVGKIPDEILKLELSARSSLALAHEQMEKAGTDVAAIRDVTRKMRALEIALHVWATWRLSTDKPELVAAEKALLSEISLERYNDEI